MVHCERNSFVSSRFLYYIINVIVAQFCVQSNHILLWKQDVAEDMQGTPQTEVHMFSERELRTYMYIYKTLLV